MIAALKQAPDESATGTELTHCLEQLRSVLNAYEAVPLDVDRNPEVAKTIVRLYSTRLKADTEAMFMTQSMRMSASYTVSYLRNKRQAQPQWPYT